MLLGLSKKKLKERKLHGRIEKIKNTYKEIKKTGKDIFIT